ncbi:hypothetical protein SeLEV6574_g01563 [Synchytrium endobioticum]|uniref:Uncharacterized protein n=1 Tax=Synchytrium endobioticum TaxID=286115 RepID=A0A507DCM1_9FUNG|nr:hypothetical protein SeLEV6574_g01563 [Synchytrium endobioticum]
MKEVACGAFGLGVYWFSRVIVLDALVAHRSSGSRRIRQVQSLEAVPPHQTHNCVLLDGPDILSGLPPTERYFIPTPQKMMRGTRGIRP